MRLLLDSDSEGLTGAWWLIGRKKHIKKETRKQNFHGMIPGFWGGFLFMCFFSPIPNDPKENKNKFLPPTQSRDNPANLFLFMCFSFPELSGMFCRSGSASQKFRRDTVRLPSAPWAHESQRFVVTQIAA